jgi:vacuolar protein sorting-associated protein 54
MDNEHRLMFQPHHNVNLILDAAVHDPHKFTLKIKTMVAAPSSLLMTLSSLQPPSSLLLAPARTADLSCPDRICPAQSRKQMEHPMSGSTLYRGVELLYGSHPTTDATLLIDFLKVIINLSLLTTDTMLCVIDFLKAFNLRTCQVILGTGAMHSAGLKIAAPLDRDHPHYVCEKFWQHFSPKQAVMVIEFDRLKCDYQEHQNEIHAKLIAIMGDHLSAHIKSLNTNRWDAPPAKPGTNKDMEVLVKEMVTLHNVLSHYLSSVNVEVCRTINSGLLMTDDVTVGIFQCNPIQSAISQNLIGQNFATELEYIGKCPQCVWVAAHDDASLCCHQSGFWKSTARLSSQLSRRKSSMFTVPLSSLCL